MSRAKQKELEQLRELKEKREAEHRAALKRIIDSEETIRISLDFAEQFLAKDTIEQPLEEYSPTQISRLVFEQQLSVIRGEFQRLPEGECRVEHFLAIMIKVMRFPFEQVPLFMVGLKDMFFQVAEEGREVVRFPQLFRYIVGELVTLREEEQNTEFQVHYREARKQDYLLHDNGIRRALFSPDQKVVLSLDDRENVIKIYDQDMRNTHRWQGRKEVHHGKNPLIVDFDYSEMTMRLAVIFPDAIIESIHLPNYLHRTPAEFEQSSLNQLSYCMAARMKRIYYVQMLNKWLTITDDGNKVYLYDMEKARSKPEEVEQEVTIDSNDLPISMVLEVVALSTVCFVAGNEISFYNEALSEMRYPRFSHHEIITNLKFSEEGNTFYLTGREEKAITIFTLPRNHGSFKITTLPLNRIVTDFEVFPHFQAILISDDTHDVRLLHEPTRTVYQHQSLSHIVKMKDRALRIQKTSKGEFMVFQTYLVSFSLEKVAIQREIEYNFQPAYYFDARKEELYLSVNGQIISFSLTFGEIRKNFSAQSSNITKHIAFFLGPKTPPFIIDDNHYLYEVYLRTEQAEGENKSYKKKVPMRDLVGSFYDEEMRALMLINEDSVLIIRNDGHNNFNTVNTIHLDDIARITACTFCPKTKYLTIMTHNHTLYQLKNFETKFSKAFRFTFPRGINDAEERVVLQHEYCSKYQLLILLNNRNEVVLVERLNPSNHVTIRLEELLPYKLKQVAFTRFTYHLLKEKNTTTPSLLLYDDSGHLLDLSIHKLITSKFANAKKEEEAFIRPFVCESYEIKAECPVSAQNIDPEQKGKLSAAEFCVLKAHEKQIVVGTKLQLQIATTLSVSKDGIIKLWNQRYSCLFVLKIPTLHKLTWNMKEIQAIKNQKSIGELRAIIAQHYSQANRQAKPLEAINKTRRMKQYVEPAKKFRFSEDMPVEIQSKEMEDLLMQEEDYRKSCQTYRGLPNSRLKFNPELSRTIDVHPWRNRREFMRLYDKASPPHKYADKIPKDLLCLRASLDMTQRRKPPPNYRLAETILPQLKAYESEKPISRKEGQREERDDKDCLDNFESCLYIKTGRRRKKANELDQIDREFLKKEIAMQNRRWIPKVGREKATSSMEMGESTALLPEQSRYDTMRDIQSVFEEHNRECTELGRGRIIQIGKINLIKDYI